MNREGLCDYMKLIRICFDDLNSMQRKLHHFHKVARPLTGLCF